MNAPLHALLYFLLFVDWPFLSAAIDYYVDGSTGDDTSSGSSAAPFRTIQRCVDELATGSPTYEAVGGDKCNGGTSYGSFPTEDYEICADLCRNAGDCEFFVLTSSSGNWFCKKANTCGSAQTWPKKRAKPFSDWATESRNCIVLEGIYHESVLVHGVKGSENATVSIRAQPGHNVSLVGTVEVTGWTEHMTVVTLDGRTLKVWESAPLADNVWQVFMQPQGHAKTDPAAQKRFEMMIPARWPNAKFSDRTVFIRDYWAVQKHSLKHGCYDDCSYHECAQEDGWASVALCTANNKLSGMLVDYGKDWRELKTATSNGQLIDATGSVAVMNSGSWQTFAQVVTHHTPGTDRFNYTADFLLLKFETNGYFLEAKKAFLDSEEEWWIDTATKKVYLITDDNQNPSTANREVRGKDLEYCISITHAAHLTVHGFHFFGCAIKASPEYPYFAGPLTVSSNEFMYATVTKRALGDPFVEKSPSMSWLYTWGNSNEDEQLPLTIFNNTWFGSEGTALNYRGKVTVDNNIFLNNDWTGVEGRDGVIGLAVVVGAGVTNTSVFTHNSLLYNGPSVTHAIDSPGAYVKGNIAAGQCYGMIQNDGSHVQTLPLRQWHTRIIYNWGFDSPKGSFRFDDSAQCFTNSPNCIGHFGTMSYNVDVGTRGLMVKGNNHQVWNNLAIGAEMRVYDKFKANDCPDRCMNNFTMARGNLGTNMVIDRSIDVLADNGADNYNSNVDIAQLDAEMPGHLFNDYRPLTSSGMNGYGPYNGRDPSATSPSEYFIPGRMEYRASFPIPHDKSVAQYSVTDVVFRPALGAVRHWVCIGCHKDGVAMASVNATCATLTSMCTQVDAPYNVHPIRSSIVGVCPNYYWRVDALLEDGSFVQGDAWEFALNVGDSAAVEEVLAPLDEGYATLDWGSTTKRPVNGDSYFTSEQVQMGGRSSNILLDFEYHLKFQLANKQGARLRNATLFMTKYASTLSDELRPEYDVGDDDDDITAYSVPPSASTWTQATLDKDFVQNNIIPAQSLIGTHTGVGHTGEVSFLITSLITDFAGRIVDGDYSFRLLGGSRRRAGTDDHFNSIYTTKGNRMAPPRILLELELPTPPDVTVVESGTGNSRTASLSWPADTYMDTPTVSIQTTSVVEPSASKRIRNRQGNGDAGAGDANNPVGLRSCDYTVKPRTPYAWFVKFDVSAFAQKTINTVTLSVSKCKSQSDCVNNCYNTNGNNCGPCPTDGAAGCGGSDITNAYVSTDDDLKLWHVDNNWDSSGSQKISIQSEYQNSWSVSSSTCDEDTLLTGANALSFSDLVATATSVGEFGTATFDVKTLVQDAADNGDGFISFRFTAVGTTQRYYIPQGQTGGPTLTIEEVKTVSEEPRWYEVEQQTWDTEAIEPSTAFSNVMNGAALQFSTTVPSTESALFRVRGITQANDMTGAVAIKGPWTFKQAFAESTICSQTTTSTTTPANVCVCANGTPVPVGDAACTNDGDNVCQNCVSTHFLQSGSCQANQCTCTNGAAVIGVACTTNGDNICQSCNSGHFLQSSSCQACGSSCHICSSNTICTICGSSTYLHGSNCVSPCPAGYHGVGTGTTGRTCEANICTCSNGLKVTDGTAACTTHGDNICQSCNSEFFLQSGSCQACGQYCDTCTSNSVCTICGSSAYLHGSTCLQSCPAGTYPLGTALTGNTCEANICTCSNGLKVTDGTAACTTHGDNICQSCNSEFFLQSSSCQACGSFCDTCSSKTVCTICGSSNYLHGSSCVSPCPLGYHGVGTGITGRTCQANVCTCSNGLKVTDGTAACTTHGDNICQSCNSEFFLQSGSCQACGQYCDTCTSNAVCTICGSSKYLDGSVCVQQCPSGSYASGTGITGRTCEACEQYCDTCTSSTDCTICGSSKYLDSSDCKDSCLVGFYEDGTGITGRTCQACEQYCDTCTSSTDCTVCGIGKFLHNADCIQSCPAGYYGSGAGAPGATCEAWGCITASSGTGCKTCVLQASRVSDDTCDTCNNGHYPSNGACEAWTCITGSGGGCLTCVDQEFRTSDSTCKTCNLGYYESGGACQAWGCTTAANAGCKTCVSLESRTSDTTCDTCNDGYYASSGTCQAYGCITGPGGACATCVSQDDRSSDAHCQTCNTGYPLLGVSCQAFSCTTGSGAGCKSCVPLAQRTSATHCSTCNGGYRVVGASCEAWTCTTAAGAGCKSCVGLASRLSDSTCATCNDGFYPSNGTCEALGCTTGPGNGCKTCAPQTIRTSSTHCATCQNGHYLSGMACQACGLNCDDCSNSTVCTTCGSGKYLANGYCVNACPSGTYGSGTGSTGRTCEACGLNCDDCNSAMVCTTCGSGKYLDSDYCVDACPLGSYGSGAGTTGLTCQACGANCDDCSSASVCITCGGGKYLDNNICVNMCSNGYHGSGTSTSGRTCEANQCNCLNGQPVLDGVACANHGDNSCQSCFSEFFLQSGSCQACGLNCDDCSSSTVCTTCGYGKYLDGQNCVNACPLGSYGSGTSTTGRTCEACGSGCVDCSSSTVCNICGRGMFLQQSPNSSCVTSCPAGYYGSGAGATGRTCEVATTTLNGGSGATTTLNGGGGGSTTFASVAVSTTLTGATTELATSYATTSEQSTQIVSTSIATPGSLESSTTTPISITGSGTTSESAAPTGTFDSTTPSLGSTSQATEIATTTTTDASASPETSVMVATSATTSLSALEATTIGSTSDATQTTVSQTTTVTEAQLPYTCGNFNSGDCLNEYNNAERNGNVAGFCRRCETEGGSNALPARCKKCCDACAPSLVTTLATTTSITRQMTLQGDVVIQADGVTASDVQAAAQYALSVRLDVPMENIEVSVVESRRLASSSLLAFDRKRRLAGTWTVTYYVKVDEVREPVVKEIVKSISFAVRDPGSDHTATSGSEGEPFMGLIRSQLETTAPAFEPASFQVTSFTARAVAATADDNASSIGDNGDNVIHFEIDSQTIVLPPRVGEDEVTNSDDELSLVPRSMLLWAIACVVSLSMCGIHFLMTKLTRKNKSESESDLDDAQQYGHQMFNVPSQSPDFIL